MKRVHMIVILLLSRYDFPNLIGTIEWTEKCKITDKDTDKDTDREFKVQDHR